MGSLFGNLTIPLKYPVWDNPHALGNIWWPGSVIQDEYTGILYRADDLGNLIAVGETTKIVNLFVNNATGSDTNSGDVANPLATIQEAFDRLPPRILHNVTIDLADNGIINIYDEVLNFKHKELWESVDVVGKSRLAVLAAGPNQVPAHALNTGDNFQITINNPAHVAWIPGALVGMYVVFTAGAHSGQIAFILANTANQLTLGYHPYSFEGPYGPTDAFDIRELTVVIRDTAGGWNVSTLELTDIRYSVQDWLNPVEFSFQNIRLGGGGLGGRTAFTYNGSVNIRFLESRIDGDFTGLLDSGPGCIRFDNSLLYVSYYNPNAVAGNTTTPSWAGTYAIGTTGIIGRLYFNGFGKSQVQIYNNNWIPNPGVTPGRRLLDIYGGTIDIFCVGMDGKTVTIPIRLSSYGFGSGGVMLGSSEIYNSQTSGIETDPSSLAQYNISIDENLGGFFTPSKIDRNALYGIDISGPSTIVFYDKTSSPVGNGIAGTRIREGAKGSFLGTVGNQPTMSGIGPAFNQIELGTRVPRQIITYLTIATDLQDLSRYGKTI